MWKREILKTLYQNNEPILMEKHPHWVETTEKHVPQLDASSCLMPRASVTQVFHSETNTSWHSEFKASLDKGTQSSHSTL